MNFLQKTVDALFRPSDTCQGGSVESLLFSVNFAVFLVGQAVPSIVRMIPIIIRMFPQLTKFTFYRGSAIIANKIDPVSEEDLARELDRKIRRDRKNESRDNQTVVKVKDAIDCVEKAFNETTLIKEFILTACKSLITGRQSSACGQSLFDRISNCIRENVLRQDTIRRSHRTTNFGRPAKGHGKGR